MWTENKFILGFVGKSEGNSLLQRPSHRWDTVTMDLKKKTGCEGVALIHLIQDSE
jgi:hypothetical protein